MTSPVPRNNVQKIFQITPVGMIHLGCKCFSGDTFTLDGGAVFKWVTLLIAFSLCNIQDITDLKLMSLTNETIED